MQTLAERMAERVREADKALYESYDGTWVRCFACAHECPIPDGSSGVCRVRVNRGGTLMVPWGYVAGTQSDPIEKKPFFHVEPGSRAFSFGMLGCDLKCACCQNWVTSQALRDPGAGADLADTSPEMIVQAALRSAEWAVAVFKAARAAGLLTGVVSNGHATPRVLEFLAPWIDLFKVDLKGFDELQYRNYGGHLEPVLETIRGLHARGTWMEVVTLLVPGINNSDEEIAQLAAFLAGVSPDIPWHVTAFHPNYRMHDRAATTPEMLVRAAEIGKREGLRFVYAGNAPGHVGDFENTVCPSCREPLVQRRAYWIGACRVTSDGRCPACQTVIPGRWRGGTPAARP
jgi:pyruvate formate lyase activating enzyme